MSRVEVRKTHKLFIGGAFVRSESGRSFEVAGRGEGPVANAARASRKDVRDAVKAARKAAPVWAGATAYNRGQVMYRVAEMMEARRAELADDVAFAEGEGGAGGQVDEAIDRIVWYAGWTDKLAQVSGALNPVAGPYFNITAPEAIGVAGLIAPEKPCLLGLIDRIAPAMCGGNATVIIASESHPLVSTTMAECIATADVPSGVVNILTGYKDELVPVLAAHGDVDALDVTGVADAHLEAIEAAAANNVKRIVRASGAPSPYEATALMEMKTVWHPKGM